MKKIIQLLIIFIIPLSFHAIGLPKLSSLPSAKATIFLDFDGHLVIGSSWNGGKPLSCNPSGMNDIQIEEVYNRVAEDYRPFNINITTDSAIFLSAPIAQRIRVIITTTSEWYLNVGGVAYTRSFTWGDDTPAFVFPDRLYHSPKNVAECCTHESGHTLGLSHQAKYSGSCTLLATYNNGTGSGETGWAPVMGNSYGKNFSGWNNGPTPSGCTADQDNLSIITGINGFTYRVDDHDNNVHDAPTALTFENNIYSEKGIISTNTDKDFFKFNLTEGGKFQLNAKPFSVGEDNAGANLDVQVTLFNSAMEVIGVYNPENILNANIDTALNPGMYYASIEGSGNNNATNYGSLGSYSISGNFATYIVMPISQVALSGEVSNENHELNWNIVSDVAVKNIDIESSNDGTLFNKVVSTGNASRHFSLNSIADQNIYYRLKVTSVTGQIAYSNIIVLNGNNNSKQYTISTLVYSEIVILAKENFKYHLTDISGRILKSGNAKEGTTHINLHNAPKGIYVIQIISNSQRITQRIVRL